MNRKRERQRASGYRSAALIFSLLSAAVLSLAACGNAGNGGETSRGDKRLHVVTTLFPYYDFTRQIAGDSVDISMVIPAGMDSHSFEPTPADIRRIQNADVLICNGGEMERWLAQVLASLDTSHMTVVTMMDCVDVVEEEVVEGMEADGDGHRHGGETGGAAGVMTDFPAPGEDAAKNAGERMEYKELPVHPGEDGHEVEIEYDEHIWTSPVNAMRIAGVIGETLQEADPEHASAYRAGAESYLERLRALDEEFCQVRREAKRDIIIMGDKFPLRYFADAYDLSYRAAFTGCSSDTEPSAKTIAYLIDKVKEEGIPAVYYLELASPRVAEIIGEETGAKPLLFHSCHNVTRRQFEEGVTYLQLMEQNVKNLREGLCR